MDAVDASPAQPVSNTAGAILTLIQVSALVLHSSVVSHWLSNQNKAAGNKDSVQLSEYCFNICKALETTIQGRGVNDLEESVRMGLEELQR